jgi:hypothetical protein
MTGPGEASGRENAEQSRSDVPTRRMVELFFTEKIRLFPKKSIQSLKKSEKNTFAA